MNAANQRQLTPILTAIAVLLGAVLLMLLLGIGATAHWNPPRAPAPLPPAGKSDALPRPVPLQQFALVWQKPLFNPERKPVARAADGSSSLGDLDLTGIILTPGLRMALLHDRNGDKQVRLHEGESLPDGSVTLVEVHPRSALFDSSAGRTELKLPAGAPIDASRPGGPHADERLDPGADEPEADEAHRPPVLSGESDVIAPPTVTPPQRARPEHARESAVERLRKNIQKRRAERAAAARKGDH